MQRWVDIEGYENRYQISDYGEVKSLDYNQQGFEKLMSLEISKKGYNYVCLSIRNIKKRFQVHRLVALHFIPNPNNLGQVNHKDGNKQNNYYENLEWCTATHNIKHAFDNKLNKISDLCRQLNGTRIKETMSMPVAQYSLSGELIKIHKSQSDAALELGIHQTGISFCIKGGSKHCGGYIWKQYKTEELCHHIQG